MKTLSLQRLEQDIKLLLPEIDLLSEIKERYAECNSRLKTYEDTGLEKFEVEYSKKDLVQLKNIFNIFCQPLSSIMKENLDGVFKRPEKSRLRFVEKMFPDVQIRKQILQRINEITQEVQDGSSI